LIDFISFSAGCWINSTYKPLWPIGAVRFVVACNSELGAIVESGGGTFYKSAIVEPETVCLNIHNVVALNLLVYEHAQSIVNNRIILFYSTVLQKMY
jgi:hypothetical protein